MKKLTIISLFIIYFGIVFTAQAGYWIYSENEPLLIEGSGDLNLEELMVGAGVYQVYQGGTGAQNFTSGECLVGAGTGAVTTATCGGSLSFGDLTDVATSSDATGDVYYLNSNGQIVNLGIGGANEVLKVSGGLPSWGADVGSIVGTVSTSSTPTSGHLAMWNTSGAFPELLDSVATSTITCAGTTSCGTGSFVVGSALTITGVDGFGQAWEITNSLLTPTSSIVTLLDGGFISNASSTISSTLNIDGLLTFGHATGTQITSDVGYLGSVVIPDVYTAITDPTGFVDKVAQLSWNNSTYTFTITGDHDIYINGVRSTKTTTSKQIADTTGLHWIYYDSAGDIQESTTNPGWHLPMIASIYWNTATNTGMIGDERHGIKMDADTHTLLHYTVGTRYESGLTGAFGNTTFTMSAGVIDDEDLPIAIPATTTCNLMYKNGDSDFEWDLAQTKYYYEGGDSNIYYNDGNNLAAVAVNSYVAYWIFASNATSTDALICLMGQETDVLIANARINNKYESLTLGTLPFQEMKLLYRVILRNDATPYEETQDLRSVSNLPGGTYVATQHNVLTGLNWSLAGHTFDTDLNIGAYNFLTTGTVLATSSIFINATTTNLDITNALSISGDYITDFNGAGLDVTAGVLTLDATGDWTGIFDGQNSPYYLDMDNFTNTGTSTLPQLTSIGTLTGLTVAGGVDFDDGSGSSPIFNMIDEDDQTLTFLKHDDGYATIANSEAAIYIKPSGDIGDYLSISTASGIVTITTIADDDGDLVISSGSDMVTINDDLTIADDLIVSGTATSTFAGGIQTKTLDVTNLVSCDTIDTNASGVLTCGTDATSAGTDPFTWPTTYSVRAAATSSNLWSQGILFASSTSYFDGLLTFDNATGSQLTLDTLYMSGDEITDFQNGGLSVDTGVLTVNATTSLNQLVTVGTIGAGVWEGTAIDFGTYTNATADEIALTISNDSIQLATTTGAFRYASTTIGATKTTFNNASTTFMLGGLAYAFNNVGVNCRTDQGVASLEAGNGTASSTQTITTAWTQTYGTWDVAQWASFYIEINETSGDPNIVYCSPFGDPN